ncbi:MAG: helix-turn-helix transcriptional regulator [Rhodocyclales bacterium]|nr:helix-turn-helix transcriptional regulator [Rhodocyclales bacterium]
MGVPNLTQHRQHPSLVALGETIRSVRIDRGISQENLALLAEVDRTHVGRVERGDNNVAILTLKKLADALEVSLAQLMKKAKL